MTPARFLRDPHPRFLAKKNKIFNYWAFSALISLEDAEIGAIVAFGTPKCFSEFHSINSRFDQGKTLEVGAERMRHYFHLLGLGKTRV